MYVVRSLKTHNIFGVKLSRVVLHHARWLHDNIIHISIPMQLISFTYGTYWCRKAMKTRQQHPSCFLRRFVLLLPQRFPIKSTKYRAESSKSAILSFTTNTLCKQSFYAFYFFLVSTSQILWNLPYLKSLKMFICQWKPAAPNRWQTSQEVVNKQGWQSNRDQNL